MSSVYETLAVELTSTVQRAAAELRRAMFAGELEPGTPLREVALAESLGVGRSTVREGLTMLAAEGLVTRVPNRGVVVSSLDPDALQDVFRARRVLEEAGVRAWSTADDSLRDALRERVAAFGQLAVSGGSAEQIARAHTDIHRALAALTGSERLVAVVDGLHGEIRLSLAGVDRARGNLAEQAAAHQALLEGLEDGPTEPVVQALRDHLAGAQDYLHRSARPRSSS